MTPNCEEIEKRKFKITKMNKDTFLVERLKKYTDKKMMALDIYDVKISGLKKMEQYYVTHYLSKEDPQ